MLASAVDLALDGPVARITLNRPEVLNAGDPRWVADLRAVVAVIAAPDRPAVAVIGGAGRAFCTASTSRLSPPGDDAGSFRGVEDAMTAIERLPCRSSPRSTVTAWGGGLQLALVCDYRLAAAEATIGLPR